MSAPTDSDDIEWPNAETCDRCGNVFETEDVVVSIRPSAEEEELKRLHGRCHRR